MASILFNPTDPCFLPNAMHSWGGDKTKFTAKADKKWLGEIRPFENSVVIYIILYESCMFHNYVCIAVNIYISWKSRGWLGLKHKRLNTSVSFRVDLLIREWKDHRLNIQLFFLLKQNLWLFLWGISKFETSPCGFILYYQNFLLQQRLLVFLICEHFIGAPDGFHINGDVKRNCNQTRQAPSNAIWNWGCKFV